MHYSEFSQGQTNMPMAKLYTDTNVYTVELCMKILPVD